MVVVSGPLQGHHDVFKGVHCPPHPLPGLAQKGQRTDQGGIQYRWGNRTAGDPLTGWKPEEARGQGAGTPGANNYRRGRARRCRSALGQDRALQVHKVTPFWKQNPGKGFPSIFGWPTTCLPRNSPRVSETAGLGFHLPSKESGWWGVGVF